MDATLIHEYIERISRLLQSEVRRTGSVHHLQPIQLEALHYLNRSNRYSDTPQGVTEYLGLTKGTVSQTLKVLESKGLIRKSPDKKDGRVVHLGVTRTGEKLLKKTMPSPAIQSAWESLKDKEQKRLGEDLQQLLLSMQKNNEMKGFGVCRTCCYNRNTSGNTFFCELTQEKLSKKDTELICREHEPDLHLNFTPTD